MRFNPEAVQSGLVRVRCDKVRGFGMGVLMESGHVLTAAHCVPLPDALRPGWDRYPVGVRPLRTNRFLTLFLEGYEPILDVAILGADPETPAYALLERALVSGRCAELPARMKPIELDGEDVHVLTHRGEWVSGTARGAGVTLHRPKARIPPGTSGSPVFDDNGFVVGVVNTASPDGPTCAFVPLHSALPGWLLCTLIRSSRP